jgi:YggT family protein
MALMVHLIHIIFLAYTLLLFVRVVGSWFPPIALSRFMRFVAFYTDPYLKVFRRIVPPIKGVFDLSPLLGFFGLQILEQLLLFLVQ